VQVVELLLARGAAVDAVSPNGSTPLMLAARYGSEESVNLLLARGADAARRNERQLRAADFARLAGREALAVRLGRP
jgi:ankyrin repeat protein